MLNSKSLWVGLVAGAGLAMLVTAGVTKFVPVQAHQRIQPLTALDYAEIQQLVARYSFAIDSGADNGYAYADLFAADGSFGKTTGRDALAASQAERPSLATQSRRLRPARRGPSASSP